MDFSKLKKTLRDDLSAIYERAQFIEKQTAARDAAVDRLTRAEAIADQAGSGIGAITHADTGTFQITEPNSTSMSSYGSYDTRTIWKDITAVMGVTFRVQ